MTCPASSLTAPVWRACDCALCCFSSQSFARANETGSRGAGLSDEWDGHFLSAVQRSLYCWSRVLTVTLTRPLWGIACHNSQIASMLPLKSGGTHVGSPPMARKRGTLRRRPGVASGSGTLFQEASAVLPCLHQLLPVTLMLHEDGMAEINKELLPAWVFSIHLPSNAQHQMHGI